MVTVAASRVIMFLFLPRAYLLAAQGLAAIIGGGERQKSAEPERVRWGFDLTAEMKEGSDGGQSRRQ